MIQVITRYPWPVAALSWPDLDGYGPGPCAERQRERGAIRQLAEPRRA